LEILLQLVDLIFQTSQNVAQESAWQCRIVDFATCFCRWSSLIVDTDKIIFLIIVRKGKTSEWETSAETVVSVEKRRRVDKTWSTESKIIVRRRWSVSNDDNGDLASAGRLLVVVERACVGVQPGVRVLGRDQFDVIRRICNTKK
jgi:hypothetical protein